MLHHMTGTTATFVHYKQSSQRLVDTMAGRVHAAVVTVATGMPNVKAGKFRAIAVTTDRRVPAAPDLPTVAEQGLKGFEYSSWTGLLAPARVPQAIVARLNAMWVAATRDPAIVNKLQPDGTIMVGNSSEEFRQFINAEADRYRKLIQETGIRIEAD
jgi:tripartite-type tricarboxylate transporter receptor subunit TctC